MEEILQVWVTIIEQAINDAAERFNQEVVPLIIALTKLLPKQPVVNRRKLAARRARRRNERKVR